MNYGIVELNRGVWSLECLESMSSVYIEDLQTYTHTQFIFV